MSEDNTPNEFPDEADTASTFEPDPATIAFLDQEAAAFAEVEAQFTATYGFEHKCHCDADYSSGKIVEVTECFAGMIVESLEACASLKRENLALREMLGVVLGVANEEAAKASDPFAVTEVKTEEEVRAENAAIETAAAEFFHGDTDLDAPAS